jgi:hypothetical protein
MGLILKRWTCVRRWISGASITTRSTARDNTPISSATHITFASSQIFIIKSKSKKIGAQMLDLYRIIHSSQIGFATSPRTYRSITLPMALHHGFHLISWATCIPIATSLSSYYIALNSSLPNHSLQGVNGRSTCHYVTPQLKAYAGYKKPSCKGSGYLACCTCKEV